MVISTLAAAAVSALVPFLVKGGEQIAENAGEDLWKLIKGKFTGDKAQKKLDKLKEKPEDKEIQERVKHELIDELEGDTDFAQQLQAILDQLPQAAKSNVQNISGERNIGIQDVSGGQINIHKGNKDN
jgi:Tfp pilus assembly protein PilN